MAYDADAVSSTIQAVVIPAANTAWQRAAYAGESIRNGVKNAVLSSADSAQLSIETAVKNLALTGATSVAQAALTASLSAQSQRDAAEAAAEAVLSGTLDRAFELGQGAAADIAEEISGGYQDLLAAEEQAAQDLADITSVTQKGRGALCNPNSSSLGGPVTTGKTFFAPSSGLGLPGIYQKVKVDRSNVQFILEVDGNNLASNYQPYVKDIIIQETCDHKISTIKLVIINDQNRFGNDSIWDRGKTIRLLFGYTGTGLKPRGNTFYSMGPKVSYGSGGEFLITVTGYGEEFLLGRTEKRRTWTNKRDSTVVQDIAAEYGWDADVDETPQLYEHIAQVNESDWKFLDRRARYYGYQVYVDHWVGDAYQTKPILHFHAPRYKSSDLSLTYMAAQNSQTISFTVWETPLQHGDEVIASQVDPLSKEIFTVTSGEVKDSITKETEGNYKGGIVSSQTLASFQGDQPSLYLFEEGHRQNSARLQAEAEAFSQSTRWLVNGAGSTVGLEQLRVRNTIEMLGIGRDSGEYYIKELATRIKSGEATSNFQVSRTWRGATAGSHVERKTVEPQKANSVSLG